jgi:hypothetical protein
MDYALSEPVNVMDKIIMTLEEAKSRFEGKPYKKEYVLQIEHAGFGFTTSAATGRISEIYKPAKPKA